MLGQPGLYGTNAFDVMTDIDQLQQTEIRSEKEEMQFNMESSKCDTIEIKENLGSISNIKENKEFSEMTYVLDL